MRILLTGGSGFIGTALSKELVKRGIEIVNVDIKTNNHHSDNGLLAQIQGDLLDKEVMSKALDYEPDGIIHLAAVSRVIDAELDKERCLLVNEELTKRLLKACEGLPKRPWFIYGSSREVYGEQHHLPVKEGCDHSPINIYGVCKHNSERCVRDYSINHSKGMVLRFSNVYGNEYDILDRVVPRFILNAINDRPLIINGGSQTFDFTHVDDTVKGIIKSMDHLCCRPGPYFEDLHLLTGNGTTLQRLVSIIAEKLESQPQVIYGPEREYDVNRFIGDPTKAEKTIGFKAMIPIEEGVSKTIDLYQEVF